MTEQLVCTASSYTTTTRFLVSSEALLRRVASKSIKCDGYVFVFALLPVLLPDLPQVHCRNGSRVRHHHGESTKPSTNPFWPSKGRSKSVEKKWR